jgi:hypothetical protein
MTTTNREKCPECPNCKSTDTCHTAGPYPGINRLCVDCGDIFQVLESPTPVSPDDVCPKCGDECCLIIGSSPCRIRELEATNAKLAAEREAAMQRAGVAECDNAALLPVVEAFARKFPRWVSVVNGPQDPDGAHALLESPHPGTAIQSELAALRSRCEQAEMVRDRLAKLERLAKFLMADERIPVCVRMEYVNDYRAALDGAADGGKGRDNSST